MLTNPGIRAGVIGAAVSALISLLGLIPFFGCLMMPLSLFLYVGVGILAAVMQQRRRPRSPTRRVAQAGFLAGLITGLVDGIVGLATVPVALNLTGGSQAILNQMPADILALVESFGLPPAEVFSTSGLFVLAALVALTTIVVATILATAGSALYAGSRPAKP